MRHYSEAVKADVRQRMGPPHRQSMAEISQQLGIHVITLYIWRKAWRLQGEVVPASQKDPEGWGPADKFTVVLETADLNATELGGYSRERGCSPSRWPAGGRPPLHRPLGRSCRRHLMPTPSHC
jgi:transposase-like protein